MAEAVTKLPIKTEGQEPGPGEWRPLPILRREIDRLFDDFGWGMMRRPARTPFDVEPFWRSFGKAPAVDIAENEKEYEVTAELPGLDENNVEVKFADGLLTIRGEKREEKEKKKKDYYLSERRSAASSAPSRFLRASTPIRLRRPSKTAC